jgi:ribosome-associated translation inhibitor RaiA
MQVSVTGERFEMGQSLRSHVVATTSLIVEHSFGKATEAHVAVRRGRGRYEAELPMRATSGPAIANAGAAQRRNFNTACPAQTP